MPPTKRRPSQQSTPSAASHRSNSGSESHRRNSKASTTSDAKKKSAKKKPPLGAVSEGAADLEPLAELTAPLTSAIGELRGKVTEAQTRIEALAPAVEVEALAAAPSAAATISKEEQKAQLQKRTGVLRIWRSFAEQRLAEMASSLEAALVNDTKLRELFDRIDTDLGGSIDQDELALALKAAGKNVKDSTVNEMFRAADYDGGGDIDYSEFADVVKGVKASKAAFVIERGIRRRQSRKLLNAIELEKRFGAALLKKSPKGLLQEWDVSRKGTLSRVEFRKGAREGFGLNFDNKDIDKWFDKFDRVTLPTPPCRD